MLNPDETEIPEINAYSSVPFARVSVEQASSLPGKAFITVITEGNARTKVYEVTIKKSNETSSNSIHSKPDFLYPNPASDLIHFNLASYNPIRSVSFIDLKGAVVYKYLNTNQEKCFDIGLQHLDSGFYLVQLENTNNEVIATKQLLKN